MNSFLKYLATAPIIMTLWLSLISVLIMIANLIYSEAL